MRRCSTWLSLWILGACCLAQGCGPISDWPSSKSDNGGDSDHSPTPPGLGGLAGGGAGQPFEDAGVASEADAGAGPIFGLDAGCEAAHDADAGDATMDAGDAQPGDAGDAQPGDAGDAGQLDGASDAQPGAADAAGVDADTAQDAGTGDAAPVLDAQSC